MTTASHPDAVSTAADPMDIKTPPMIGGGEMGRLVRETDWSGTPLGAYATWPQSLRSALSLVLNAKGIAALYWGPEQWLLYNDAYGAALGDRHPWAFGRPMSEALADVATVLGPQTAEVLRTGAGFAIENLPMVMRRHGRDEETVWTYSFSPVQGETGDFAGVLLLATEMTQQKAAERSETRGRVRLETAIRVAQLGTFDWQPSTGAIQVDARGREMFDLPAEGILTEASTFGRIAPEDVERVRIEATAVMGVEHPFDPNHLGRTIDFAYDVLHRDGSRRSIVSSGTIIVDSDNTRRMIGSFDDVTELKRADALLRAQNAFLEERVAERTQDRNVIWQVSRELLAVTDDQARLLRVNPAWSRVLGWNEEEFIGRTTEWMEHPDDRAKTHDIRAKLAERGVDIFIENRMRCVDGSYRNLAWTAVPVNNQFYCSGRDVTEETERAETLRRSQKRAALYFDFSQDYLFLVQVDAQGGVLFEAMNQACASAMGLVAADIVHRSIDSILPDDSAADIKTYARLCLETGDAQRYLATREYRTGQQIVIEGRVVLVERSDGGGGLVLFSGTDVTEQRHTEDALRQSQKMEAVGQLTGGLAHDFNNLLTGISGSLDLLQKRVAQGRFNDLERYVVAAQGASKRAAALTHRLLAFSRRQTLDPKPTDVSKLIKSMADLIRRTVGPEIAIEIVDMVGLWTALVDPNQLENALLNLAINARDAMPDGGRITVETDNKWMDERAARERDLPPGQYLSICLSDTGTGMAPDVVARAFDPFYTTKPLGLGTGLGLSMIYGFARQSGGQVRIYSEVGQGTTVCMYLPRHYGDEEAATFHQHDEVRGAEVGETVLVVDDEATIRMLVTDVLSDLGYGALEAEDGAAGLRILRSGARVDLLVTDVGLPNGMNGRQVADAAREIRPGLKVLFITGYAQNAVVGNGHLDPGMSIMTKPFAMDDLAVRIRSLIGG